VKIKRVCAVAAMTIIAVPVSSAIAGNGDKATGGGQIMFQSSDEKRSTMAFNAQGTVDSAKGHVRVIYRANGSGQEQIRWYGIVDCLEVTGNYAVIGGANRNGTRFVLRVVDNGEPNKGRDLIGFDEESENNGCGDDEADATPDFTLAKGNAQVRDGDSTNPAARTSRSEGLRLLGLK
jgi:hypothetical protein